MRKVLIFLLVFFSLLALLLRFGYQPLIKALNLYPKAGLRIDSNLKAKVLLNEKQVGIVPYQDENLAEGEYLVSLQLPTEATQSGKVSWQGYVKLNKETLTVVNRDLADTQAASSGEVITLEKGQGATVISAPMGAELNVDGNVVGRTPMAISSLKSGEHRFLVGKDNFLKRSIRAAVVDGYNLTLNVDLAIAEVDLTKVPTIPITNTAQVTVKQTPTGFLRVRSAPNLNADEIDKISSGTTLTLLEEAADWDRIKTPTGKEGYVSSSYVEKKTQ